MTKSLHEFTLEIILPAQWVKGNNQNKDTILNSKFVDKIYEVMGESDDVLYYVKDGEHFLDCMIISDGTKEDAILDLIKAVHNIDNRIVVTLG